MPESGRYDDLVERLAAIEEELRDLAYERLADAARGGGDDDDDAGGGGGGGGGGGASASAAEERRLNQARRAIARAIAALQS
jgi:hypothetical protein